MSKVTSIGSVQNWWFFTPVSGSTCSIQLGGRGLDGELELVGASLVELDVGAVVRAIGGVICMKVPEVALPPSTSLPVDLSMMV